MNSKFSSTLSSSSSLKETIREIEKDDDLIDILCKKVIDKLGSK